MFKNDFYGIDREKYIFFLYKLEGDADYYGYAYVGMYV